MSSFDGLQARNLLAKGVVVTSIDDTPIILRLRYIGTGTVTSVVPTTATNLVLTTSDGGVQTYAFATYSTVGALADKINGDGIFEVKILDALRADATTASNIVENSSITSGVDANGVVVWDLHADTSVNKSITACVTYNRDFNTTKLAATHRVHLQEIVYNVDISAAAANGVRVYLRRGTTETQIIWRASVDTTATTINFASGQGKISGKDGDEFIVRVQDATSVTDAAANFVQATGILE